jgi:hypothetical protein
MLGGAGTYLWRRWRLILLIQRYAVGGGCRFRWARPIPVGRGRRLASANSPPLVERVPPDDTAKYRPASAALVRSLAVAPRFAVGRVFGCCEARLGKVGGSGSQHGWRSRSVLLLARTNPCSSTI